MPSLGRHLVVNLDEMRKKARANVDQTWTDGDAEVIAFLEPDDEHRELPADSEVGGARFEPVTPAW
jgi:hypothetical protein